MRELADARHLDGRLVSAGDEALEQRALRQASADGDGGPHRAELLGTERPLDPGQERPDDDQTAPARTQLRQDREALGRLVVLGRRSLERQRCPLRQGAHVRRADPGGEVVRQPMRLVVSARHHDHRPPGRDLGPTRREVGRPGRCRHTKDARLRQMGPKGVDERCDATITAARRGHGPRMVAEVSRCGPDSLPARVAPATGPPTAGRFSPARAARRGRVGRRE